MPIELMNVYKSLRIFSFDILDALDHAEILASSVLLDCKEAASVHIAGVDVDHEVLESLELGLCVVVIAQQLFD
jgi:hypothetical protein